MCIAGAGAVSHEQLCELSEKVFQLQLRCIPSISEAIADKLAEQFSDIESLQDALRDVNTSPRIRVNRLILQIRTTTSVVTCWLAGWFGGFLKLLCWRSFTCF